jgi:hypothetical protein
VSLSSSSVSSPAQGSENTTGASVSGPPTAYRSRPHCSHCTSSRHRCAAGDTPTAGCDASCAAATMPRSVAAPDVGVPLDSRATWAQQGRGRMWERRRRSSSSTLDRQEQPHSGHTGSVAPCQACRSSSHTSWGRAPHTARHRRTRRPLRCPALLHPAASGRSAAAQRAS